MAQWNHFIVPSGNNIVKFIKFDFPIVKHIKASSDSKVWVSTSDQIFFSKFGYFLFWVVHYMLDHLERKVSSFCYLVCYENYLYLVNFQF